MHHWVAGGVVGADAEGEGADRSAGIALLVFTEKGPGERYRTFGVVREGFVADRAVVD